jgi:hypothetical protein
MVLQRKKTRGAPGDPAVAGKVATVIQRTDHYGPVLFLLDAGLHHPDVSDNRRTVSQCSESGGDRIMAEPHECSHREVADSNRAPLPDPVLG